MSTAKVISSSDLDSPQRMASNKQPLPSIGFDISALDARFKAHAQRGIGRYVRELAKYFDQHQPAQLSIAPFDYHQLSAGRNVDRLINLLPFGRQTFRQQIVYPLTLAYGTPAKCKALHFPAHMDAPLWGKSKTIVTVLDLIPLVCADLYRAQRSNWRFKFGRWLEMKAIQNASLILAISECTARDVERLLHIPRHKIVVTPLGVDEQFFTKPQEMQHNHEYLKKELNILPDQKTILFVGGIDPRKNWRGLIESFCAVRERALTHNQTPPLLIMAGRFNGDDQYPLLCRLIEEKGIKQHVRLLDYVSDDRLFALYGLCSVFFFPSLYEGFGLTPLEALAAGMPVVCSNRSSLPEVVGDAALLVDPTDSNACAEALWNLLTNEPRVAAMRLKGPQQARQFTWERTGEKTLAAYQTLLHGDLR